MRLDLIIAALLAAILLAVSQACAGASPAALPASTPGGNLSLAPRPQTQSPFPFYLTPGILLYPPQGSQACPRPHLGADLILTDSMRKAGSFDPSTVRLLLEGNDVTARAVLRELMTYPSGRITLIYTPTADLALGPHRATLAYPANASPGLSWQFTVAAIPCP